MKIKHMPCGLFWHFDSGLERSPSFPMANDCIEIGCRIEGVDDGDLMLMYRKKVAESWSRLAGRRKMNDKQYYSFTLPPIDEICEIEYYFTPCLNDKEACSQIYSFSTVKQINLNFPTVVTDNRNLLRLQFSIENQTLELIFNKTTGNFLTSYLIDKVTQSCGFFNDVILFETRITNNILYIINAHSKKEVAKISLALTALLEASGNCISLKYTFELPGTSVFGGGEKFDSVNAQGKTLVCNVVEQYANQSDKTYLPIPFFFTEQQAGILQASTMRSDFSFERSGHSTIISLRAHCTLQAEPISLYFIEGEPKNQIKKYIDITGKQALAPKWAFGPWMSSNGWNTQGEALEQIAFMNELKIPATVEVLEAWSDEETFYIWNDAQYIPTKEGVYTYSDFTFSEDGKWPNPMEFVKTLSDNNVKLVLWQIPVVKYEKAPHGQQLDLDESYAIENNLCIHNADGTPYRITEMWFGNSLMPDYTNPNTKKWWFDKRRYLVEELGVAGFKTDGGEFLFDTTAVLHDKRTGAQVHNEYANLYAGAYHEFMNNLMGDGNGVTFSRAGYTGAQKFPIHWAGDQISTWSELRGQLTAGLSLGLSGVPFWSFDIGGFAGDFPSTELYLRSALLAVFSPIMQFHSEPRNGQYYITERERWNNDRTPWNIAAANNDDIAILIYRKLANLRMNLLPYIWDTAKNCVASSRPMMAHLLYDYPLDQSVYDIDDEFMFGCKLLVAPIIKEAKCSRNLYLPLGAWHSFTTGERYESGNSDMICELSDIPVFVKENSIIPVNINQSFIMGDTEKCAAISNNVDTYEQLCFLVYGNGSINFTDDLGNNITIMAVHGKIEVSGLIRTNITIIPVTQSYATSFSRPVKEIEVKFFKSRLIGYQILEQLKGE